MLILNVAHTNILSFKALLPACMKCTAQGESPVANIAKLYLFVTRLSSRAVYFVQTKQQCFKCFIVFYTLIKCQQNAVLWSTTLAHVHYGSWL